MCLHRFVPREGLADESSVTDLMITTTTRSVSNVCLLNFCALALQMTSKTKRWKRCCRRGRPVRSGAARHEAGCWANPRDSAIGSARGDARISERDAHCGAFARSQFVPPAVLSYLYPARSPNEKVGSFACRSIGCRRVQRRLERRV